MNDWIFLSDVHLTAKPFECRTDDTVAVQFRKLNFVIDYANKKNATVLMAGDIFDRPRSWHLLPLAILEFSKFKHTPFVVYGQHDTYLYSEETRDSTNLGILAKAKKVVVLGPDPMDFGDICLYGCHYGQPTPKVKVKDRFNILVVHKGIAEKALFPGHEYLDAESYLKKHKGYEIILCGDIHSRFTKDSDGRRIVNTGPMLRVKVDLWEHKPGFFHANLETGEWEWIEIPHDPPSKSMTRDHIIREEEASEMLEEFVKSIQQAEQDDVDFVALLAEYIKANDFGPRVVQILSEVMGEKDV